MDAHTRIADARRHHHRGVLAFDYTNGFHDAANSIATVVATRVLIAGGRRDLGRRFLTLSPSSSLEQPSQKLSAATWSILTRSRIAISCTCCSAAVLGAIAWNLITWYFGLPTSSSHALVGAYAGAAMTAYMWNFGTAGMMTVLKAEGWIKTLAFIVLSPLIGMLLGFFLMVAVYWIFHRVSCESRRSDVSCRAALLGGGVFSSATAATTLKRRWASSRSASSPAAFCI